MSLFETIKLPNGKEYEQPLGLFINNEWVATEDTLETIDPATGKVITKLFIGNEKYVDDAVKAARAAFESPEWSGIPSSERGDYLFKISQIIKRDAELIASIECYDNGKPWDECIGGDIVEAYEVFKYYGGFADKLAGKVIEPSPDKLTYMRQEPLGVCGQIIPWNFPFMMLAWKVAPAIACGNTVVLKPSEVTPLTAAYFGKVILEAGLPKGVVNIVQGYGKDVGNAISIHKGVDKVAFTGSTATGKLIMKNAAESNLKNVTLECGGKSPYIIFDDANIDQAAKWGWYGIFYNKGEVCTSTSRFYVQEKIYDEFIAKFKEFCESTIKISSPFEEGCTIGPLVSKQQLDKVVSYIDIGVKEGAKLVSGGKKVKEETGGYFIQPTIFADCTEEMRINTEEIFGPVVSISKFTDEAEVISKADDSQYGLGAALFSKDVTRCHKVAHKIQAGMVWINSNGDSHFGVPFGGYKSSGIGRELGPYALDMYTQTKAIHINLGADI
ncbi:hypothetical protein BVG19_g1180 [[Candida] boidinii]|nr:hypothetical protein BVG19_g1180 [[Candida] boidinii]OWB52315.1 oxidoreductase activity protein [[Candida] boidinii]